MSAQDNTPKVRGREGNLRRDIPKIKWDFPECKSAVSLNRAEDLS